MIPPARRAAQLAGLIGVLCTACQPPVRVGAPCASPPSFTPFDDHPTASRPVAPDDAPADRADGMLDAMVAWYQHHGRSRELPGIGCPFAPTCSAYARTALHAYGPLGVILIVDRLIVREHGLAAAYYPAVCVDHTTRLSDDVP